MGQRTPLTLQERDTGTGNSRARGLALQVLARLSAATPHRPTLINQTDMLEVCKLKG